MINFVDFMHDNCNLSMVFWGENEAEVYVF